MKLLGFNNWSHLRVQPDNDDRFIFKEREQLQEVTVNGFGIGDTLCLEGEFEAADISITNNSADDNSVALQVRKPLISL